MSLVMSEKWLIVHYELFTMSMYLIMRLIV